MLQNSFHEGAEVSNDEGEKIGKREEREMRRDEREKRSGKRGECYVST